jgi:hypothetical protein
VFIVNAFSRIVPINMLSSFLLPLINVLARQRPGFDLKLVHMGFVMSRIALRHVVL